MKLSYDMTEFLAKSSDPSAAKNDLARLKEAIARLDIPGIPFKECWPIPFNLLGNSAVLSQRMISDPQGCLEIASSKYKNKIKDPSTMRKELGEIPGFDSADTEAFAQTLRKFKYREFCRITSKEIEGASPEKEILREWSDAASVIISAAYDHIFRKLSEKNGPPIKEARGTQCTGCIIALGKLGGRELNFSSDVDILSIYSTDEAHSTAPDGTTISSHEFFVRLTIEITKMLSRATDEGFLFRVDHELRPEGKSGPLANSIDAAERYYQYFGHDWERQALIRASCVAGENSLAQDFIERLRPFVFKRSRSLSELSGMREMKLKIEKFGASEAEPDNLKTGSGGIREAEFFVQALQLLYGGRIESLKLPNTFDALDALSSESLIHHHAAKSIGEAYSFLRRVENILQARDEAQIHSLPSSPEEIEKISCILGFNSGYEFISKLDSHRKIVHRFFSSLFEMDYEFEELRCAIQSNIESCASEEEVADSFAWFKSQEYRRILGLEESGKISLIESQRRLSLVARVVVSAALSEAQSSLRKRFGRPILESGEEAHFAIIGLGRLGAEEMDYGSDLDLIFVYSGNGTTDGSQKISNAEFFTRVAQRLISRLSLHSRYGKAYQVDSELRPSGNAGALVTTLESFNFYHEQEARIWERLAMIKAMAISGEDSFIGEVQNAIEYAAFDKAIPTPSELAEEIDSIRNRAFTELGKNNPEKIDIKKGVGGSSDLDSIIRFFQLSNLHTHPSLRVKNSFQLLNALEAAEITDADESEEMKRALSFFRLSTSRLRLISNNQSDVLEEKSEIVAKAASMCGFKTAYEFVSEARRTMKQVNDIYERRIKKARKPGP